MIASIPAASRRRRASASSAASGLAGSAVPWSRPTPGATNANTLSTCPSVSRSSTSPFSSQTIRSTPEPVAQAPLDVGARHRRVAVRVQQALLGRDERARAVDGDRAAFEHERRTVANEAEARAEACTQRRVGVEGLVFAAPAVEAEVDGPALPRVVGQSDRAGVAHPRVVERFLDHLDTVDARECGGGLGARTRCSRRPSPVRSARSPAPSPRTRRAAGSSSGPHNGSRAGQATSVRSCGAHSAGIENPSAAGVDMRTGLGGLDRPGQPVATSGRGGSMTVPGPRSSRACTGSPPNAGQ